MKCKECRYWDEGEGYDLRTGLQVQVDNLAEMAEKLIEPSHRIAAKAMVAAFRILLSEVEKEVEKNEK